MYKLFKNEHFFLQQIKKSFLSKYLNIQTDIATLRLNKFILKSIIIKELFRYCRDVFISKKYIQASPN